MMDAAIVFRGVILFVIALCVPLLMYIGFKLFEMGAKGEINISHEADGRTSKITNLSPGAFCFLLAVALGGYLTFSDLKIENKREETTSVVDKLDKEDLNIMTDLKAEPAPGLKTVTTTTRLSLYDGGNLPLSTLVTSEYAQLGICFHGAYVTNQMKDERLENCLEGVNEMMRRPISHGLLKDLRKFERNLEDGDKESEDQIDAWKSDYILTKES